MRAVRVTERRVAVVDVPEPRPAPDEQLIRVAYTGVCGTDRKLVRRGATPPRVPGHEVVGVLADGMAVGVHPDIGCGNCSGCAIEYDNRCMDRTTIGLNRDGGLAELVAVPASHVVPLEGLDLADGPLLEPLACCLHAVTSLGVEADDDVLVIGAGPMGVLCMWTLQAEGARVTVVQRSAQRRTMARRLGADSVVAPDEPLDCEPDAAIVTAPGKEPLEYAMRTVRVGGRIHAFAGTPGGAAVDANTFHYRHLALIGTTGSTVDDYRRAITLASSGVVDLSRMPRTTVSFEEAARHLAEPSEDVFKLIVAAGSSAGRENAT